MIIDRDEDLKRHQTEPAGQNDLLSSADHEPPILVMQAVWSAWGERDFAGLLSWYADDAVWCLNLPREVVPFGGANEGKAAIKDAFTGLDGQFETIFIRPATVREDDDVVRGLLEFGVRHRLTGLTFEGSSLHRCVVRDGLVRRVDATFDVGHIRAYMGIVALRASQMNDDLLRAD